MSFYRGMTCENVTINGDKGTPITAYVAKPSGPGPFPGVVLVHHLPGWSELYIETTRRFAHHGYLAICANLYERAGQGNPDDVAAKVRADGGISDAQMVGDTAPVQVAGTPSFMPARERTSTPASSSGAAAWSWARRSSMPRRPSRRSR